MITAIRLLIVVLGVWAHVAFYWFVYGLWPKSWFAYVGIVLFGILLSVLNELLKDKEYD